MKYLICRDCGAPFMGIQIPETLPPMCQVCNSENMREADVKVSQAQIDFEDQHDRMRR